MSPDGRVLVAMRGGLLTFFDFRADRFVAVHYTRNGAFHRLRFAPDGKTLAVGTRYGMIRIFEAPRLDPPAK